MLSLVEFINGTPVQSSYPRAGYYVGQAGGRRPSCEVFQLESEELAV